MVELADALDLGSSAVKGVQVQVLFPAPKLGSLVSLGISAADSRASPLETSSRPLIASSSSPVPGTILDSVGEAQTPEAASFLRSFPLHCVPYDQSYSTEF